MEKGQIVEIKIEDMSNEGQGIGKADGFVVFVPDTVPGDVVRAELVKVKKNYGSAKVTEIVESSPDRTDEFDCAFFEEGCGGCPYGSMQYDAQLALKERQVTDKLQRIAGIDDPVIRDIIGMTDDDNDGNGHYRYRNKAQFPVSTGGNITRKGGIVENLEEPKVGFFRKKSHDVIDCGDCYIQSLAAVAAADALRRFMKEDNITAWDPKWEKGLMRHLIVKTGFNTGEVMVILVINGKGVPNIQKLVAMLDEAVYNSRHTLESVVLSTKKVNDGSAGIMGSRNNVIAGKESIYDSVGHLKLEISPGSFYQVNTVQMERLYDKVREYCGLGSYGEHVDADGEEKAPVILDLYCGVGSIGLYCADSAEYVVGIESVKEAVVDANRNAVINGIVNARYICGRAEEVLPEYLSGDDIGDDAADPELAEMIQRADIVILDPPRAGCDPKLLDTVSTMDVKKIVYVSCDPATMARDIKIFAEKGYDMEEATPVDMFPNTAGVETVALLR